MEIELVGFAATEKWQAVKNEPKGSYFGPVVGEFSVHSAPKREEKAGKKGGEKGGKPGPC